MTGRQRNDACLRRPVKGRGPTWYYSEDRDFILVTHDASDIAAIEKTFGDDFTDTAVTPPTGDDLVWSPTNSSTSILGLLNGTSAAAAFLGSENFSSTSLGANRELGIVMSDETVMTSLNTTLTSDYAGGTAY